MWCARYFMGPDRDVDEMEEPCQFASVPLICLLINMCCVLCVKTLCGSEQVVGTVTLYCIVGIGYVKGNR